MPFPFSLPTTSSFSFSGSFLSDTHPSLSLSTSTYRGVVRDVLKKHKRLPSSEQPQNLSAVLQSLNTYLPYLFAIDSGLSNQSISGEILDVVLKSTPVFEWRPTLSVAALPGRDAQRLKIYSIEYELYFSLSTMAYTYTLLSRTSLYPLYSSATASPTAEQRTSAIAAASKHLLFAASIHEYLATRSEQISLDPPCVDMSQSTFRALASLALAEATLLAVLKDDPYPAAVAQARNKNDNEWMIKAPEIPKVKAHLFARLCLAAAEYAANAVSLFGSNSMKGHGKLDPELQRYAEDVRKTGRAKACRFFGIDADLSGQTGNGIAWAQAGLKELGVSPSASSTQKTLSLSRFKKERAEKQEDRKIEKGSVWGADGGKFEESRVLEVLESKWSKMNDTINTQIVPPIGPLMATMPSGREIHSLKAFVPTVLDAETLQRMRATPEKSAYNDFNSSSDEGESQILPGAFPGAAKEYAGDSGRSYY